jgi:hypothetical protein
MVGAVLGYSVRARLAPVGETSGSTSVTHPFRVRIAIYLCGIVPQTLEKGLSLW